MAKQIISKPSAFRDIFTFAPSSKDLTRWFPGHMHKGLVKIESMLKNVDCVVEVHDARIPFSGRNTNFRNVMSVRPHLLVLNKADLADLSYREQVDERLKQQGVNAVLYTDCKKQSNTVVKKQLIPTITELIEGAPRYNREETELYNLLVIGVPNVGKSSLINSLRRIHLRKGKATRVGALAGVTRNMQEKVKVCNRPLMYLYDTPGILAPSVKSIDVGLKLALTATMKDHIVGVDTIADYMLYSLNKLENFKYVEYFELPAATDNILDLLAHIAQKYDKVAKVRSANNQGYVYRPHFDAAAVIALQAFRQGKLGHVMLDTDVLRDINKPR